MIAKNYPDNYPQNAMTSYRITKKLKEYYEKADENELSDIGKIVKADIQHIEDVEGYFKKRVRTIKNALTQNLSGDDLFLIKLDIDSFGADEVFELYKAFLEADIENRKTIDNYLKKADINQDLEGLKKILQQISHNNADERYLIWDIKRDEILNAQSKIVEYSNMHKTFSYDDLIYYKEPLKSLRNLNVKVEIASDISEKEKDRVNIFVRETARLYNFDNDQIFQYFIKYGAAPVAYLYWEWDLWNKLWFKWLTQIYIGRGDLQMSFCEKLKDEISLLKFFTFNKSVSSFNAYREFANHINLKQAFIHFNNENRNLDKNNEDYIYIAKKDLTDNRFINKSINQILSDTSLKKRFKEMCESGLESKSKMETFEKRLKHVFECIHGFNQRTGRTLRCDEYTTIRAVFRALYVNDKRMNRRKTGKMLENILKDDIEKIDFNEYHHVSTLISMQIREEYGMGKEYYEKTQDSINRFALYSFSVLENISREACYASDDEITDMIQKLRQKMLIPIESLLKALIN